MNAKKVWMLIVLIMALVPRDTSARKARPKECQAIVVEFRKALESAHGRCKSDRDCATYPTFVDCGGFTDRASARKLNRIYVRYPRLGCGHTLVRCAPKEPQVPFCGKGQCRGKPDPCYKLRGEFYYALQASPGRCKSDADCARYPRGVTDCGGVTDKATADKLRPLGARHTRLRCHRRPNSQRCPRKKAPVPVCRKGACQAR